MRKLKMNATINHEVKFTALAGGIIPVAPIKIGMLINRKSFTFG
jgi:hypothetical protein